MASLPPTRWNPSGWTSNCGFCSISYALELQKNVLLNADQLYEQTLERLGIVRQGNHDPIPRLLIFPGLNLDEARIRVEYHELEGRGRGAADYTIWSVARSAGLELKSGDKNMLNGLVKFAAEARPGWKLDDFVNAWMSRPGLPGTATFTAMKRHVEQNLKGVSIIGSIPRQHFVNMHFSPSGEWKVFDAQRGQSYDGRRIKAELASLDLFERVSTSG